MYLVLLFYSSSCGRGEEDYDEAHKRGAVLKAVQHAESKHEKQEEKEATAVADATMDVIKSESDASNVVPEAVLDKAKDEAKKTFKELDEANVGNKVAADAAAKVAVAEVDGASGLDLKKKVKKDAEEAAVATEAGLSDPHRSSLGAAIETVEKEERTGKVDLADKTLVAKAKEVVSDLPAMTEGAVRRTTNRVGFVGILGLLALVGVAGAISYRAYKEHYEETPYMKSLRLIREEYQDGNHFPKEVEFGDPDLQYTEMR